MKVNELLAFLESRQPMPSDSLITEDECNQFMEIIEFFSINKSNQCIPLLIFSVSKNTGLGMYESICDVLAFQDKEHVTKNLRIALEHGDDAVKQRCCWWAADICAWCLEKEISLLVNDKNEDLRDAAHAFVSLKQELA